MTSHTLITGTSHNVSDPFNDAVLEWNTFVQSKEQIESSWELFADLTVNEGKEQRDHVKVWRQLQTSSGLYKWKVWGVLKNIDLELFHKFVSDLEYRKVWDPATTMLKVIEIVQDPASEETIQFLWWRVSVPFPFFTDRDFVFSRQVKHVGELTIIYDRSVQHPKAPKVNDAIRVDTYNRYLIYKKLDNGIEVLMSYITAVDPGGSIPKFIVNWGASTGSKNFLSKVREGYEKYPQWLKSKQQQQQVSK